MHKRNTRHLLMNEQSGLDLLDTYNITYIKKLKIYKRGI